MSIFRRSSPDDLDRIRAEILRLSEAMNTQERAAVPAPADTDASPDEASAAVQAELLARLDALADQVGALELRVTAVATELANQLGELGNEIDALGQRPGGEPIAGEVIDTLRDSQTRLANEQARYQIAFREDLARLAEQLRRPR